MPGELYPILEPFQLLIARSHTAVELLGLAEDGKLVVVVLFGEVDVHLVSTRVKPLDVEPGRAGAEVLLIALVIRLDSLVELCIHLKVRFIIFLFVVPDNQTSIHKSQDIKCSIYCAFSPAHTALNLNQTGGI